MLQLEKFSITDQNTSQTLVICANQMLIICRRVVTVSLINVSTIKQGLNASITSHSMEETFQQWWSPLKAENSQQNSNLWPQRPQKWPYCCNLVTLTVPLFIYRPYIYSVCLVSHDLYGPPLGPCWYRWLSPDSPLTSRLVHCTYCRSSVLTILHIWQF